MKRELLKIPALIFLFISLSLLLSFTSSVDLSKTGLGGFIGISIPKGEKQEVPEKTIPFDYEEANMRKINEMSDPPQIPLFFVEGLNQYTHHLRLYTATKYRNGEWIEDEGDYNDRQVITGGKITKYSVIPLIPFENHIPVAKDTFFVTTSARYNAETGTYLVENVSIRYDAFSSSYKIEGGRAEGRFMEINVPGIDEIRKLTLEITRDAKSDYERAKLIEKYLSENYKYDTEPWNSTNPVYTFIFEEKRGICKHFASAFVIMCRSIGLPARAVFGYLAKPVSHNQTIFASQAHMWAEVKFEEGWIEFDPTPPPGDKIQTTTEITYIDSVAKKGGNFTVEGFVNTTGISHGYVEIYLKKDKNEGGNLVGILSVNNGFFHGNVTVPDISGEYHVVAHFVGSMRYASSWSDPIIKIYNSPGIDAIIPDKAAERCVIDGGVYDQNGTAIKNAFVILKVDGKSYISNTGKSGIFTFDITFDREGIYEIEIYYPGDNFTLPSSIKKQIEVGNISLRIYNTSGIRGEEWNTTGEIYFGGKPMDSFIIFEGLTDTVSQNGKFRISTKIPENFPLGTVPVNYTISELKYTSQIFLNVKAKTFLDVNLKKDKNWLVLVSIKDDRGNPVSGEVVIANRTVIARNGVARLETEDLPEKFTVEFQGDERYLPSSKLVDRTGFPLWILTFVIPAVAFLAYRMRKENYIEFEWGDLPPVWDVGEEVRITIKNRGKGILRASLDRKGIEEIGERLELKFVFREVGNYILRAERLVNGKVKESKEIEIKIMNYRDAIIETFGNLVRIVEERKGINLKDLTAREVMKEIKASNSKEFLRLFEIAKYGYGEITRKDFSIAYRSFLSIVEGIQ